jgi:hypothetical protein
MKDLPRIVGLVLIGIASGLLFQLSAKDWQTWVTGALGLVGGGITLALAGGTAIRTWRAAGADDHAMREGATAYGMKSVGALVVGLCLGTLLGVLGTKHYWWERSPENTAEAWADASNGKAKDIGDRLLDKEVGKRDARQGTEAARAAEPARR